MSKINSFIITLFALFLITACQKGEVKDTLGLTKSAPDEFMVLSRPSLTMPPNFNLVSPAEKTELHVSNKVREDAHSAITGSNGSTNTNDTISNGENLLLSKSNIKTDKDIRKTLAEEYNLQKEEDDSFVGSVRQALNTISNKGDAELLDAKKEQERLNKESISK